MRGLQGGVPGLVRRRLFHATRHSFSGLRACFHTEEAFRVEVLLTLLLLPLAWWLGETALERLVLMAVLVAVLIVELLNSAVEKAVDRVSTEYHPLAKQAKDMGSAAVLLSLLLCGITWITFICQNVVTG